MKRNLAVYFGSSAPLMALLGLLQIALGFPFVVVALCVGGWALFGVVLSGKLARWRWDDAA